MMRSVLVLVAILVSLGDVAQAGILKPGGGTGATTLAALPDRGDVSLMPYFYAGTYAGNPNGNVACTYQYRQWVVDSLTQTPYVCTTTGIASVAVWSLTGKRPGAIVDHSRAGGCSTATGCGAPNGGMWLVGSHLWDSSPGVWDDGASGAYLSSIGHSAAYQTDPIGDTSPSTAHAIPAAVAGASCGTAGGSGIAFCPSITGMIAGTAGSTDTDDNKFCRNTTTPFAPCNSNDAACGSTITGADDPHPIIVRSAVTPAGTDYQYLAMMVTGYAGCASAAANTLTVQPFPDIFQKDGTDSWEPALQDQVHPGDYYGGYIAQRLLTAAVDDEYYPRNNLAAAWNTDASTDCTGGTNWTGGTASTIAHDQTKAAWLGSWSAISGIACKFNFVGAANIITSPAINVQPGWYTMRMKVGTDGTGTAPTIEVLDQADADYQSTVVTIVRGYKSGPYGLATSTTLSENELSGWTTLVVRFFVPPLADSAIAQQTARIKITADAAANNGNVYVDEWYMWPSADQGAGFRTETGTPTYMIPYGTSARVLVYTDSRGLTTTSNLVAHLNAEAVYLRPDLHLSIVEDALASRRVGALGYDGSAYEWYTFVKSGGYDYVIVWLGAANALLAPTQPSATIARYISEAESGIKAAGAIPIWIQEAPLASNSAFSTPSNKMCVDENGVTRLVCAKTFERIFRALVRGGMLN